MSATPTKVYPLRDRIAPGVPHVVTELPSKAEAEALEATGAFTTNPNDPNRIPDAEIPQAVDAPTHVVGNGGLVEAIEAEAPAPKAASKTATPASSSTSSEPAPSGQEA